MSGALDGDELEHAAGGAAKDAALVTASRDLGADRRMSGMRRGRGPALALGYDPTGRGTVTVKLRPAGLWRLADRGRRRTVTVRPRRRGGVLKYGTTYAAYTRPGRTAGHDTIADTEQAWDRTVPAAVGKMLERLLTAPGGR
jgi:hypothetical protein